MSVQSWNALPRFAAIMPVALATTLGLLLGMAHLIHSDVVFTDPDPYPIIPPVVMEPPKPQPAATIKPEPIDPPEPLPAKPKDEWETPDEPQIAITRPPVEVVRDTFIGSADSLPFARVMAPPVYPYKAARRGVEGFVDLRFDVTASGATKNIQVIRAEPEGVFEESAVSAVARWRFQPMISDGEPVPFTGLSKRVRFTMEK